MNTAFSFKEEPFEAYSEFDEEAFDAELADLEWEEEVRRGRRPPTRTTTRHRQPGRLRRPVPSRPRPPKRYPLRRPVIIGSRIVHEPAPCVCPAHGTEFVRWVQSSLNQVLGLNLPVNGVMDTATRSALRRFQEQQGLPVDGIAGPETERALIEAKTSQPSQAGEPPESGEFEDLDLGELEWEGEVNRQSPEYVRWVQSSLNQILGLKLAVDGKIGPQTRSAIRSFQQKHSLPPDGIVGPRTASALNAALRRMHQVPLAQRPYQLTVGGFSQYRKDVTSLPPTEHANIEKAARLVVRSYGPQQQPINMIRLVGHADKDTPRRPTFERKISEDRARAVQQLLMAAINRYAAPQCPPLSERIDWHVLGAGATQLLVERPASEAERKRNRRVEISFARIPDYRIVYLQASLDGNALDLSRLGKENDNIKNAIEDFCQRLGKSKPSEHWCGPRVDEVLSRLKQALMKTKAFEEAKKKCSQLSKAFNLTFVAPTITKGKDCDRADRYLVVQYKDTQLAKVVERLKQALDCGCVVKTGVLSGRCYDLPDQTCAHLKPWECPEHWILIIGYDNQENAFVFWDPSESSALDGCDGKRSRQFGLLFYDSSEHRLPTAPPRKENGPDHMRVSRDIKKPYQDGLHLTLSPPQKRFQVLLFWPPSPYREPGHRCNLRR